MMWQEIIVYLILAITIGIIVFSIGRQLAGKHKRRCSCGGNCKSCNHCCTCKQDLSKKHTDCTLKRS